MKGTRLGIVLHVGEIGERIVADGVTAGVASGVADRWKIFGVRLPGFACGGEVADDLVCIDGKVVRRDGVGERERRESLSSAELEIVWTRRMGVGEVICREAVLVGEAVQVRHRGICDDVTVIGVFLDDNEDVAKPHALGGGGVMATCPTRPASATMQKANASNRNRAADRMCERDACICLDLCIEFFLENSAGEPLRMPRTTLLR